MRLFKKIPSSQPYQKTSSGRVLKNSNPSIQNKNCKKLKNINNKYLRVDQQLNACHLHIQYNNKKQSTCKYNALKN